MQVTIETEAYNARRYSCPWIAIVTFGDDGKESLDFGRWVGRSGEPGRLLVNAEPYDIIRHGQKDNRPTGRTPQSENRYGMVMPDGSVEWMPRDTPLVAVMDKFRDAQTLKSACNSAQ